MKKILLALAILAVATASAFAGVGINWMTGYGVYDHTQSDLTGGTGAILDNYSVTWQLIYAGANNSIDVPNDSSGSINGDYVTGDDVVWGSRTIPLGGGASAEVGDTTVWNEWMLYDSGNAVYENLGWNTVGSVYQRILELPVAGGVSYYFDTGLVALNLAYTGGGQSADDFLVDGGVGIQPNQQIPGAPIPEPATMALLGLGALTMAIRRRRA